MNQHHRLGRWCWYSMWSKKIEWTHKQSSWFQVEFFYSIWNLEIVIQRRSSRYPHFEEDGSVTDGSHRINGLQKKISSYGKNAGVELIGILDYTTGDVYCEEHERYDAKAFLNFLEATLKIFDITILLFIYYLRIAKATRLKSGVLNLLNRNKTSG